MELVGVPSGIEAAARVMQDGLEAMTNSTKQILELLRAESGICGNRTHRV